VNRRAAHPIGLQCDLYHVAASGEDPVAILQRVAPWLRHVQIADYPGRAEPGTGTIDWPVVFETLQQIRYEGFVGLEYRPSGNVAATLGRLRTATRRPPENLK
jgi:hydroxypyruvate isomerase